MELLPTNQRATLQKAKNEITRFWMMGFLSSLAFLNGLISEMQEIVMSKYHVWLYMVGLVGQIGLVGLGLKIYYTRYLSRPFPLLNPSILQLRMSLSKPFFVLRVGVIISVSLVLQLVVMVSCTAYLSAPWWGFLLSMLLISVGKIYHASILWERYGSFVVPNRLNSRF